MKPLLAILLCVATLCANSQNLSNDAAAFISTLTPNQKKATLFPFESDERYNFHYFPINDRKGLPLSQMNERQKKAAFKLLNNALTDATIKKVHEIIELEVLLKQLENRAADDQFRDPGKYFLALFGTPGEKNIWGWRFEGHHVSFNFSSKNNTLVAGTPGFLGSNPAIVQDGPEKGKEILREEKELALSFIRSLTKDQLRVALIDSIAPDEIITGNKRKAIIENTQGISYAELNPAQQKQLSQVLQLYVDRYKKPFADQMMKEIQQAGYEKLKFAWAGHLQTGPGHPHYYRITGPTIIIEYDNTQNNANHVHTVVRDLLHDYGGDELLEHYKHGHGKN
jgi:hypothetical protein